MKSRQINRAKRVSNGCKNNGDCDWCRNSRTYSNAHRQPVEVDLWEAEEILEEMNRERGEEE